MLKKNCGKLLSLSLALLVSACSTMPPDIPVCVEFAPDHGRCVKIISGEKFDVDEEQKFEGKTWWEYRPAMMLVPASSWAKLKAYTIKACKKYGNCQKEVSSWDRTIEIIDESLAQKAPQTLPSGSPAPVP